MAFVCSISGEVPMEPVVSLASKMIYEKRLLEQWVEQNGTDPVTGDSMSADDILIIKVNPLSKPRAPSLTSIPQILLTLQNEWDSTMLYTHKLSQNLSETRKELLTSMYMKDAAYRVIARQLSEKKSLENIVGDVVPQDIGADQNEEVRLQQIRDAVIEKSKSIIPLRKKLTKNMPVGLPTNENFASLHQIYENNTLHSPRKEKIFSVDLKPESEFVVTGGADRFVVLFDKESTRVVKKFKAHSKKISKVAFYPDSSKDLIISSSSDQSICLWNYTNESNDEAITRFNFHNSAVVGFDVHPVNDFILSGDHTYNWCFSDVAAQKVVFSGSLESKTLNCIRCHPDGLIFATASNDISKEKIHIWDVCTGSTIAQFSGDAGEVKSLCFSENGYHLMSLCESNNGSFVSVWDLRKLKNTNNIAIDPAFSAHTLTVDPSSHYMAVGGNNGLIVYNTKVWDIVGSVELPKSDISDLKFHKNSSHITSVGLDRRLRYFTI